MDEGLKRLARALGVGTRGGGREGSSVGRKGQALALLIKRVNIKHPPRGRLELAQNQGVILTSTVGLPTPVLMRIP